MIKMEICYSVKDEKMKGKKQNRLRSDHSEVAVEPAMFHRIENTLQIAMKKPDANCIKIGVRLMAGRVV